jgi:hypothetical protein
MMHPLSMPPGTDRRSPGRRTTRVSCELRRLGATVGETGVLSEGSTTGLYVHTRHPAQSGEWVAVMLPNDVVVDGQVVRREGGSRPGMAISIRQAYRSGCAMDASTVIDALLH